MEPTERSAGHGSSSQDRTEETGNYVVLIGAESSSVDDDCHDSFCSNHLPSDNWIFHLYNCKKMNIPIVNSRVVKCCVLLAAFADLYLILCSLDCETLSEVKIVGDVFLYIGYHIS